jgi:pilus assembly protein CpaC
MSRTNLKRLGINLQNITSHGNFGLQLLQGPDIGYYGADPSTTYFPNSGNPLNALYRRGASTNATALLRYKDTTSVLDAIETNGMATILAEPTLTTTTGKAASFLAGGQYPLPVQGQNGTVTVQYEPFGVSLNFTPVVMSKNRMSITIAPEVSTLDFNNPITVANFTYPILNTRKASAVLELGSGDTFALAGLLSNDTSNNINKTPGLGEIPVLGALFRSTQFQNNQSELVILVTPYIVHPVSEQGRLQTPMDGYVPPSDLQLLLNGELFTQQPMKRNVEKKITSAPKLSGEGGFILE